ncbi:uncharacterized protein LOC130307425 [Hyla sarda]|uniref:uncharacterized protein LOC130307425 n=1 Tax=Hyla sarda TaxID=327740 RepID=UPI0024C421B2|nr:uncharacterized protein LOC130307425 [Hyla sarda]
MICSSGEEEFQTTVLSVTTSVSPPVLKTTPVFTQTEPAVSTITITEEPEVTPTQDPGPRLDLPSSNTSPFSHQPETSSSPQLPQSANSDISDTSKQTNNINDIFADDDDNDDTLSSNNDRTISPEIDNIVKDLPPASVEPVITESQATPYDETEDFIQDTSQNKENYERLGLEPWKVGVISAAAFLAIEAMVLAVYCFMCRKRRQVNIVENCDRDSEAGETINVESNDNTVSGEERTINGGPAQNGGTSAKPIEQQEAQQQERVDLQVRLLDKKSTDV